MPDNHLSGYFFNFVEFTEEELQRSHNVPFSSFRHQFRKISKVGGENGATLLTVQSPS